MSQWKFQLLANQKGVISIGYLMDEIGKSIENEVNDALRYPFKFHKVNKIVVEMGPSERNKPEYIELLGVGVKQFPDFDAFQYKESLDRDKVQKLRSVVTEVFAWLEDNFDDAQFVEKGRKNLGWKPDNALH